MKIGLITYHSAYNFGSVLQCYATQETLKKLGHDVEVINYRMPSQKNYYSLFPKGMNLKTTLKYLLLLSSIKTRRTRGEKYENIINSIFNLTEEFNEPQEIEKIKDNYEVYISGSDQIWNRYSNELFNVDWKKYMGPYLLNFTNRKKVSYASSICSMNDNELNSIKNQLVEFNHISCRETSGAKRISQLLNRDIESVLDPTFLMNRNEWIDFLKNWKNPYTKEQYVLYYSLKGTRALNHDLKILNRLAEKNKYKIIAIVPLAYVIPRKNIILASDAAVYDFLGLINSSNCVITDSYHGTILSINLNKTVFSLQEKGKTNIRIDDVASKLCFKDHIIYDINDVEVNKKFDYELINQNIDKYRELSLDYLKNAILN